MAKSVVLKALKIFGLEEMLKLSAPAQVKSMAMKKAAGAELIVWDDASEAEAVPRASTEAAILPFKRLEPSKHEKPEAEVQASKTDENPETETTHFYSSEFLLWQRELTKDTGPSKEKAVSGYARSSEMYVVKTPTIEGKEKIRFASTNGVLVNKKQA